MKAIVRVKSKEKNVQVMEIPEPVPGAGEICVEMRAARINPVDLQLLGGMPFLKYKTPPIAGVDGAGVVKAVGSGVTNLKAGDAVYFYRRFNDIGSWAQVSLVRAQDAARISNRLSVEEAGSIALTALTAWAMLEKLQAKRGQSILIHGAGGGVGIQAVQFARHLGLRVIATAGEKDAPILESIGVQQVIDYRKQDFSSLLQIGSVDFILDTVGGDTLLKSIALKPKRVISVHYPVVDEMKNVGVELPFFLKPLFSLMNKKFADAAARSQVALLGQVTGPNSDLLQKISDAIDAMPAYHMPPAQQLTLRQIAELGKLSQPQVGNVIHFQ